MLSIVGNTVDAVIDAGAFATGALRQVVNEVFEVVATPVFGLPDVPPGDVFEPRSEAARAGADLIERWSSSIRGSSPVDPQDARRGRELLAAIPVWGRGSGTTCRLDFQVHAPGTDRAIEGREASPVAVYVDGRYHSTAVVIDEAGGAAHVNLGEIAPGRHLVELRSADELVGPRAVRPVVTRIAATTLGGLQALVAAHAPIVAMRDVDIATARHSSMRSDTPLLIVPHATTNEDGTVTIRYDAVFSGEDGGSSPQALFEEYGHALDVEPLYRVTLDRSGRRVRAEHQVPIHRWIAFTGAYDGQRPLLRIASANNMTSARSSPEEPERWSGAPIAIEATPLNDAQLLREQPWLWNVMWDEIRRERSIRG